VCEKVWVKCKPYKLDKAFITFIDIYISALDTFNVALKVTENRLFKNYFWSKLNKSCPGS